MLPYWENHSYDHLYWKFEKTSPCILKKPSGGCSNQPQNPSYFLLTLSPLNLILQYSQQKSSPEYLYHMTPRCCIEESQMQSTTYIHSTSQKALYRKSHKPQGASWLDSSNADNPDPSAPPSVWNSIASLNTSVFLKSVAPKL
jgi:hypothetical protein